MKLSELLVNQPDVLRIPNARSEINQAFRDSGKRLVVIDDDPLGAQTIHGVSVFLDWSVDVIRRAITSGEPVFYICTNSRNLNSEDAWTLSLEVGRNLRDAARMEGVEIIITSRIDSTLRGHFPYEVCALASGFGQDLDGIIIVPAFFEAGRFTIDDIHWVEQDGEMVPVHKTEFARDPVFGFKHSDLKAWVAEKMGNAVKYQDVHSISLRLLREDGPEGVAEKLAGVSGSAPVIVNAACYEDLEVLALGVLAEERKGKTFAYCCAASFIKARGGFEDKPLLTHQDLATGKGLGLIVVGSYVEKTSRQLKQLLTSGLAQGIELRIQKLQSEESRKIEIEVVSQSVNEQLAAGVTTVLYTSRAVHLASGQNFLEIGNTIMLSLCEIIRRVQFCPDYLVAKGGNTSIELARRTLDVRQAFVLGQIIAGVPVWRLGAGARWPDIPYVVYPGNVGNDYSLRKVVEILEGL